MEKLLTNITEVQYADGKLYVSPVLDCFNGEIVALEMRDNMKKELCIGTVKQLCKSTAGLTELSFTVTVAASTQATLFAGNL